MRRIILWVCLLSSKLVCGQLYDKTWICCNHPSKVVFEATSIDTVCLVPYNKTLSQWASISDKNGNFQFYTNGIDVFSYDTTLMVNGNGLADNSVNIAFALGLTDQQNVIILPKNENQYYIIYHSQSDFAFATRPWYNPDRLYYSVVDMSLQGGKGEVTVKRETINTGNFMDGQLTACQHANGRDWWLVHRRYNFNSYLIYLVTPDTISFVREQQIGAVSNEPDAVGQAAFSPDGSKYASITGKSPLIILDFDRCEGVFSNPQKIEIPRDTFTFYSQTKIIGGGGNGLCFSPNNQYIYVNSLYILRQYDLLASPIDSSEQVLFFWTDSNEHLGQFNQMHLAPNGKIYIANYQGFTYALHVINEPDSAGLACGFVKWGLPIPANSASQTSNMVHYRMGALAGSGCDTITTATSPNLSEGEEQRQIQVFPNPASDVVSVELSNYNLYNPQQQFYLYNSQGELVKQIALPYLSAQFKVNDLPSGVYHWRVAVKGQNKFTGKLEVVR